MAPDKRASVMWDPYYNKTMHTVATESGGTTPD